MLCISFSVISVISVVRSEAPATTERHLPFSTHLKLVEFLGLSNNVKMTVSNLVKFILSE